MSEGWICPKCGSVYAPWVTECVRCGNHVHIEYVPTITYKWCQDCGRNYRSDLIHWCSKDKFNKDISGCEVKITGGY